MFKNIKTYQLLFLSVFIVHTNAIFVSEAFEERKPVEGRVLDNPYGNNDGRLGYAKTIEEQMEQQRQHEEHQKQIQEHVERNVPIDQGTHLHLRNDPMFDTQTRVDLIQDSLQEALGDDITLLQKNHLAEFKAKLEAVNMPSFFDGIISEQEQVRLKEFFRKDKVAESVQDIYRSVEAIHNREGQESYLQEFDLTSAVNKLHKLVKQEFPQISYEENKALQKRVQDFWNIARGGEIIPGAKSTSDILKVAVGGSVAIGGIAFCIVALLILTIYQPSAW